MDFLVELRGFEPPTCAVRAPTPIDAATASKLSYCRGRSAGSDSDRRCFTYTAQRYAPEGLLDRAASRRYRRLGDDELFELWFQFSDIA
jgi:hypothetical protein